MVGGGRWFRRRPCLRRIGGRSPCSGPRGEELRLEVGKEAVANNPFAWETCQIGSYLGRGDWEIVRRHVPAHSLG